MRFLRGLFMTFFCFILLLFFSDNTDAKIVVDSKIDGVSSLYIIDDDGSNRRLLTDTLNPGIPRWSPDGKQIVFQRLVNPRDIQRYHLFLMNADGTNIQQLTSPEDTYRDVHPSFSPDGKFVLFRRLQEERGKEEHHICTINLATGSIRELVDLPTNKPTWSPDGKKIIFFNIGNLANKMSNIWIMEADGGNPRELLRPANPPPRLSIHRSNPRWSQDSKKILYTETHIKLVDDANGNVQRVPAGYHYFIYDLQRQQTKRLNIPKNLRYVEVCWMDNDRSIVFTAGIEELNVPFEEPMPLYNLHKYHIATGELERLTELQEREYGLDWISDDTYNVSPKDKKVIQWGKLKTNILGQLYLVQEFVREIGLNVVK